MPRVLTVTPNPALDVFAATAQVRPTRKLRCDDVSRTAGGGGVNVARVLHALGTSCSAIFPQGGTTGALLQSLLLQEGVSHRALQLRGLTRESFTVLDRSSGQEFRFVLPGPDMDAAEVQTLLACVRDELHAPSEPVDTRPGWLVVSGSLAPGVSLDFHGAIAVLAREAGVRLVVDAGGESLRAALNHQVYLAKPSLSELRALTGRELAALQDVADSAAALVGQGAAHLLVVSLGEQGALLVSREGVLYAAPLDVPVRSAVGAGDSLVAGMVAALSAGRATGEAFRYGVACAGASLSLRSGQSLEKQVVEALHGRTHITSGLPTRMELP